MVKLDSLLGQCERVGIKTNNRTSSFKDLTEMRNDIHIYTIINHCY